MQCCNCKEMGWVGLHCIAGSTKGVIGCLGKGVCRLPECSPSLFGSRLGLVACPQQCKKRPSSLHCWERPNWACPGCAAWLALGPPKVVGSSSPRCTPPVQATKPGEVARVTALSTPLTTSPAAIQSPPLVARAPFVVLRRRSVRGPLGARLAGEERWWSPSAAPPRSVDLSSFDLLSLPNSCSWVIDPMHALLVCVHFYDLDVLILCF